MATETETTVVAQPVTEPETKPVTDDGNIVEHNGKRYIVESALAEARDENKKLKGSLNALEPLMPEFEQFLNQREQRNRATVDRTRQEDSPYTEDELDGLAITRGYFAEDGSTPDRKRAKAELDILTRVAGREAGRLVKPVAEMSTRERARTNRSGAYDQKYVDGRPVADPQYLDAAFDALEKDAPEALAEPRVAQLVQVIAAGLQSLDERRNGRKPRREPNFRERGSGRIYDDGDDNEISDFDVAAARARGKTPEEWKKLSDRANKSRGGVLEEIG